MRALNSINVNNITYIIDQEAVESVAMEAVE